MAQNVAAADTIATLHAIVEGKAPPQELAALIDDTAVFHSPVLHTPQEGAALVQLYLGAALMMFSQYGFHYVREIIEGNDAALEFKAEIDGIAVNGVDIIRFNNAGKIIDFKVMIRPLKGIEAVRAKMMEQLAAAKSG